MTSDAVRWTRKYFKYSSTTIRRKKQIFDDDSPVTRIVTSTTTALIPESTRTVAVTSTSATTVATAPVASVITAGTLEYPVTKRSQDLDEILVNFSNVTDKFRSTTANRLNATATTVITSENSSSSSSSSCFNKNSEENNFSNTANNISSSCFNSNQIFDNIDELNRNRLINNYPYRDNSLELSLTKNSGSYNITNIQENCTCKSDKNHSNISKNKNNNTNTTLNLKKLIKTLFSEILVIMSTLINYRSKLRAFFSVLPIIIVILQVNFIFSDIIMSVVATKSNDDLYNDKNFINNYNITNSFDLNMNDVNSINSHYDEEGVGHYTSTWAVHIPNGDSGLADEVAREHGFINLGKIFDDHYHFEHNKISKRSIEPSHHHQIRLNTDERVRWSKQQRAKSRTKRDFIRMRPSRTSSSRTLSLIDSIQLTDPKWPQMWYLNRGGGLDMNVIPAWKEGVTGKGVVVTILDDGLESDHPDLEHNYDPKASYDVNSHDEDPMPHYDMTDSNRHGTRCAGEVAATANNSLCAVGIAFGARVGGVRMLDGDVTDAVEARSLSLNPQHIDIYSASWGPDDDGKTVDGPGELASRAFIEGVTKGRNGKGSIFIWASGNGGRELDNCNCDGYTNSIWTLSISSATEDGHVPWYSEKCSSTLATTYSSGGQSEKQVVTTDLHHSCTISHTGTSASAPLAAGIVALVLEANRNLTWRDLQHIVVRTAKPGNLKDPTWSKNGVGRRVSHSFGYGLMDAAAMVKVARTWRTVPEQQRCEINAPHVDKKIPAKSYITLQLTVRHCMGVNFLEHVQAKITLTSQRRGDIQIYLKSPAGTKVTLLTSRMHDVSRSGFNQWPFMSVHTWGEAPHGNWQLEIHNEGRYMGHALLREWSLIFYGTATAIDKNDPISVIRPTQSSLDMLLTSSTSPITLLTHHQFHLPQYPRLPQLSSSNSNSYSILVLNKSNSKLNSLLPNVNTNNNSSSSISISGSSTNNSGKKQQHQQQQHHQQQQQQQQKQQQQQSNYHQISSYGVIMTSPKKNGKNSKNNSSGGKGGNKGSGNGGNQKSPSSSSSLSSSSSSSSYLSTNRPNSQTNSNQASSGTSTSGSKNNFYRISSSLMSPSTSNKLSSGSIPASGNGKQFSTMGLTTSSQRPKLSQQQSNYNINYGGNLNSKQDKPLRVNEKIPIKAPKQVKDNNAYINSGSGISSISSSSIGGINNKGISSNSNLSAKDRSSSSISGSSISSSTAISSSSLLPSSSLSSTKERYENSYERIPIHNQRIPKLFEKYEKIQQIFPEFHPYTGPKDGPATFFTSSSSSSSSLSSSSSRTSSNRKQHSQNYESASSSGSSSSSSSSASNKLKSNNKDGGVVGGGGDGGIDTNSNGGQISVIATGSNPKPSRENSKKISSNSQNDRERERDKSKERIYIPNRKNMNAQITQWDLIFYGTEKPAQPNDPIRISPGQYGAYGGELEHNLLDFDSQTASGQWRNMQQVGESHVDVQRTTSNDQTSSACLEYSPDQRCIECHQTTFIYEGRCYAACPNGTYMVPEVPENYPKTYLVEPLLMTSNDRIDTYSDSNSIDNTDTDNVGRIGSDAYNYYRRFGEKRAIMRPVLQKRCAACDPSCLQCNGPNAGDCTLCPPGYQLRKLPSTGTFCYYLAERSSGNSGQGDVHGVSNQKLNRIDNDDNGDSDDDDSGIRNDLYMFLVIIVPAISMIFLIVALTLFGRKLFRSCKRRDANDYSYDRVAFNIDEDDDYDYDNENCMNR